MRFSLVLMLCCVAGGCDSDQPPAGEPGENRHPDEQDPEQIEHPYGFEVWFDDFPGAPESPHLSPRRPGLWYDRTRRQALESIAAKLDGSCSREAWKFSSDLCSRIDAEDVEVLVRALDSALQVPEFADHAENLVEAIGRARQPSAGAALVRALEHPRISIRNKAMQALETVGGADSVRAAFAYFGYVEPRGQVGWIRAAGTFFEPDEQVAYFETLLVEPSYRGLANEMLGQLLKLSPEVALRALAPLAKAPPGSLLPTLYALRHAAGDRSGTVHLRELLVADAPQLRASAIGVLPIAGKAEFVEFIVRGAVDPDPTVRLAAVNATVGLEGEQIEAALEQCTLDESLEVRRSALRALVERGKTQVLDDVVNAVRTATGTRRTLAMEDLIAVRFGGAIPAMLERMADSPADEQFEFLRAIALIQVPESFAPLRTAFLDSRDAPAVASKIAYLMTNCRGAELEVLVLFDELEPGDTMGRAMVLTTLGHIAADREDRAICDPIYARMRTLLADASAVPQLRLLALETLRRDLRLEDVAVIKVLASGESPSMRAALTDFLFEFF